MSSSAESLLIAGSGALASLFAARFAAVDLPVKMLGNWSEGVKALRDQGVHLIDIDGRESRHPVEIFDPLSVPQRHSHVLVLVKSWQTERTAQQLNSYLSPDGCVLTLQNGLGNREILVSYHGEENVFTGVVTSGATLLGPGRVLAGGDGSISLVENPDLGLFVEWFQRAGLSVQLVTDMDSLIWGKLVVNAAINPMTALLGVLNGELLHIPAAREIMDKLAREVVAVGQANGVNLNINDPAAVVEEVARKTSTNRSSMLQDIQRGAPTEIDAICGAVRKIGNDLGVPTPMNDALYHLIKALVEKNSLS